MHTVSAALTVVTYCILPTAVFQVGPRFVPESPPHSRGRKEHIRAARAPAIPRYVFPDRKASLCASPRVNWSRKVHKRSRFPGTT
jgi:hypothetical protein